MKGLGNTTEAQHLSQSSLGPPSSSQITRNDVVNQATDSTHRTVVPSSDTFSTPPGLIYNLSPYGRIPLPLTTSVPVTLNPMLQYDPTPGIAYSIASSPSSATPNKPYLAHSQWLKEPATFPNVPYLTIRVPWQAGAIVVFPGDPTVHGIVTIWDVLVAVHRALRVEAAGICSNGCPSLQSPALFYGRGQRNIMRPDEGTIRVSMMLLLQDRATWKGLSPSTEEGEVWRLHIG